jgi:hypothetical protein
MISVIKTYIDSDLEWKEFLRNQYNLFYDFKFNSYNDVFNKNIKWHHLKFKDTESNKVLAIMIGCEKIVNGKLTYVSCDGVSFEDSFGRKNKSNKLFEITESHKLFKS